MLKAKQNSFLKWFIGIVLLVVALCSFMTTALAAPDPDNDIYTCAICNERFAFFDCDKNDTVIFITYQDYFSVQEIPGITNENSCYYVNGYGYVGPPDNKAVYVADYNGNPICYSCLEQKVAEYKTANSLNATVPASLPIHVGGDGKVTTASNASITNNGSKPIVVSSINIAASSGWTVQSKVDAANAKAGSKVIAIGFNNSWATPNSGNTSNVTDMSSMFYDCSSLTSLDLSNFDTSNVTNMSRMFERCNNLPSLDVSGFNTSNVTYMNYMFSGCSGLTSLDVSGFDTANVTNMNSMFFSCSKLTTIYAGDTWNTDKVTSSSYMFSGCTNLPNFSSSKVDKTAATFTTNGGYLTRKAAAKSLKLNVDQSGTVNGYTEQSAA